MNKSDSRVTIHMAASLDGFIARQDGTVDWLETSDEYAAGDTLDPEYVEAFLNSIDCYVMGSRTYETALQFDTQELGWPYGDKPVYVLTTRELSKIRESVVFHQGDLVQFVNEELRPKYGSIWIAGGGAVCNESLRLGLVDEISYSILPVLIGEGISFFDKLEQDISLHLTEAKAYRSGMIDLRYEVMKDCSSSQNGS